MVNNKDETNNKGRPRTVKDKSRLIHLYRDEGYSIESLCETYNRNISSITNKLIELGLLSKEGKKQNNLKVIEDIDNELLKYLKKKRAIIANKQNVPAYFILYNYTLEYMATKVPTTKEEMLKIPGLKEAKYDQYGEYFLNAIKEYNSIKERLHNEDKKQKSKMLDDIISSL